MAEAASITIPEPVKKLVRAVLISKMGGVPLSRFPKDYKNLIGEDFPMLSLGFSKLIDCMKSMPDVVTIKGEDPDTCTLYGIGDDTSFMSGPAIMAQFPVEGKQNERQRRRRRNRNIGSKKENNKKTNNTNTSSEKIAVIPSTSTKYPDLVPNMIGLYAVLVRGVADDFTASKIYQIFSMDASIINTSQYKDFYFYRFSTVHEAERIIEKYDGCIVNGRKIVVTPAQEKAARNKPKHEDVSESKSPKSFNEKPLENAMTGKNDTGYPTSYDHVKNTQLNDFSSTSVKSPQPSENRSSNCIGETTENVIKRINGNFDAEGKKTESKAKQRMKGKGDSNRGRQQSHGQTDNRTSGNKHRNSQMKNNKPAHNLRNEFVTEKTLSEQLEAIGDLLSLPKLLEYHVHIDNMEKSLTEDRMMKIFKRFSPKNCRLGKPSPSREYRHGDLKFTTMEDVVAFSKQLPDKIIMGKCIRAHLSFITVNQLGLDYEKMGIPHPDGIPKKSPGTKSSFDQYEQDKCSTSVDSMLSALPETVQEKPAYVSDSESSTTRRRRRCILDILENETSWE